MSRKIKIIGIAIIVLFLVMACRMSYQIVEMHDIVRGYNSADRQIDKLDERRANNYAKKTDVD